MPRGRTRKNRDGALSEKAILSRLWSRERWVLAHLHSPTWKTSRITYNNVQLTVWDVFLLDSDFKIERPTRYYRQGLHLLHRDNPISDELDDLPMAGHELDIGRHEGGTLSKVAARLSKTLHIGHSRDVNGHTQDGNITSVTSAVRRGRSNSSSSASSSSSSSSESGMMDPSTNMNPMRTTELEDVPENEADDRKQKHQKKKEKRQSQEVSKHTFYISNSQMRLKLFAKNEVSADGLRRV